MRRGAHDRNLLCRINAAFRGQLERRIYAAEPGARRNLSCAHYRRRRQESQNSRKVRHERAIVTDVTSFVDLYIVRTNIETKATESSLALLSFNGSVAPGQITPTGRKTALPVEPPTTRKRARSRPPQASSFSCSSSCSVRWAFSAPEKRIEDEKEHEDEHETLNRFFRHALASSSTMRSRPPGVEIDFQTAIIHLGSLGILQTSNPFDVSVGIAFI